MYYYIRVRIFVILYQTFSIRHTSFFHSRNMHLLGSKLRYVRSTRVFSESELTVPDYNATAMRVRDA